jgi:hypothetical protein
MMTPLFEVYRAHDGLYWIITSDSNAYLCTEQELYEQINEILANLEYHNGTPHHL